MLAPPASEPSQPTQPASALAIGPLQPASSTSNADLPAAPALGTQPDVMLDGPKLEQGDHTDVAMEASTDAEPAAGQ